MKDKKSMDEMNMYLITKYSNDIQTLKNQKSKYQIMQKQLEERVSILEKGLEKIKSAEEILEMSYISETQHKKVLDLEEMIENIELTINRLLNNIIPAIGTKISDIDSRIYNAQILLNATKQKLNYL